jgi:glycosyltransferase involved in cell wall biosynthesis
MRILVLMPYLPFPPHGGGQIRMLELIRFLRARHDVTVVSFVFSEREMAYAEALSGECQRVIPVLHRRQLRAVTDERPYLVKELSTPEMKSCLAALNAKSRFDLVDVEHIFMAQYASLIDAPAVLQEHNIESVVLKRYASINAYGYGQRSSLTEGSAFHDAEAEWKKMARYESLIWPQFPLRLVVSEIDRVEMMRRCPLGRVVTVPNGVDTQDVRAVAALESQGVMFTGALDYHPNLDAALLLCDLIWPRVRERVPRARLYIVGRNPPAELLKRAKRGHITIAANVARHEPYAEKCSVSVVPLRAGGGTRLKILFSMATGLSVISTSVGCEGLELEAGRELLIEDDPARFADLVADLLEDKERRYALARAGRVAVEARYDWRQIFPILEREYQEIARSRRPRSAPSQTFARNSSG